MDLANLVQPADTKILLVVMDGLGGYADAEHGTELEEAATPNLDQLAREGTAGTGRAGRPRHHTRLGPGPPRPVRLRPRAVRARAAARSRPRDSTSSCSRATSPPAATSPRSTPTARSPTGAPGASPTPRRVPSSTSCRPAVQVPGVEVFFRHEREHRVLVVLRGPGLDPRLVRHRPAAAPACRRSPSTPLDPEAKRTADLVAELDAQVRAALADDPKANVVLLPRVRHAPRAARASTPASACAPPRSPSTRCTAGSPACSAWTCSAAPPTSTSSSTILRDAWNDYDYFFLHHKYTDSAG